MAKPRPKLLTANFEYLEEYAAERFHRPTRSIKKGTFADYQNGTIEEPSGGACQGSSDTLVAGSVLTFGNEGQLRLTLKKQLTPWQEHET